MLVGRRVACHTPLNDYKTEPDEEPVPPQRIATMPKAKTKRKPSVSIIGPGRLGQALAIALYSSGYPIKALVGRPAAHSPKDELDQLPPSDLILITTPDDAIEDTARRLA